MRMIRTIITVVFFAYWTCSLTSMHAVVLHLLNKWCCTCCMGRNVGECRSPTSFRGRERVSHYVLMLLLSFNTNVDGIPVLKQNANRAIILATNLSYAPCAAFPHFLEAFLASYFPASKILLI